MDTWLSYLKRGLSRRLTDDPLAGQPARADARASLANLRHFLARHWPRGLFGALLILVSSLLSFPQPLLLAYLVDKVILAQRLERLLPVVLLMVAVVVAGLSESAL
jgi:ABC-type bacteriocin/lantibiotic exporter with double-glycine peptidase domain